MVLSAPKFIDKTGYFPNTSIESEYYTLNESLKLLRHHIGDGLYEKLCEMSAQTRAHFESDPDKTNGGTVLGREIFYEMEEILEQRLREVDPVLWRGGDQTVF